MIFIGHSPCYTQTIKRRCLLWQRIKILSSRSQASSTITDSRRSSSGRLIRCAKEPENPFDSDAVRAFLPCIGKVGYIANSPDTRAGGTESASRIYDRVPKRFYIRVLFTTFTKVICRVERGDMNALNREFERQCVEDGDTNWD